MRPGLEVGKFNMVNGQVAIIAKRMESYSGSRDRATSMLLDEPTSAVVTPEIGFADQFALLESGEPVHCAPPDEIFKHPEDKWIKPFLQTYHERNARGAK